MSEFSREHWHLDKRVPLALIVTIFLQTAGAIWWAASMSERMDQIERRMENAAIRSQNIDTLVASQATQIAVLVERIDTQNRQLDRLSEQVSESNSIMRQYLRENGRGAP